MPLFSNQQNQSSASMQRMSMPPAASQSEGAGNENVWVTVPVDKVEVANGKGTITPTYATNKGYQSPQVGNTIPPTAAAGRQ